ncbi:MAG: hypothetical protein E7620_01685 [Ruminococcaceae bacterium]|nr:hypothetical protein [Oscillospiraceae bacterium]
MKRILCLFLCFWITVSLVACNRQASDGSPEETVLGTGATTENAPAQNENVTRPFAEITDNIFYMFEGELRLLNFSVHTPENAEGTVNWSSSNDCVIVEHGVVYAQREGYSIVSGGGESSCIVRVLPKTLPVLNLNVGGESITSKETYVDCTVSMTTSNEEYCFENAAAGIRLRGNSTLSKPKKPYRIKFDSKRNLLGMNEGAKCKSWVLLAEWFDASMIHNSTSLSLASEILTEYTSDWRYVNVYIDGIYQGVYLLAEQSQINENRVNIEEAGADTENILSGYFFEQENSSEDPFLTIDVQSYQYTNFLGESYVPHVRYFHFELKNDDTTPEQEAFAKRYFQNVFKAIHMATYENCYMAIDENGYLVPSDAKTAEEAIRALIDVDSLARKYIHSELTCNWDDRQKSYYTHVDFSEGGTGLFTFSCPWDFDHAFYRWKYYTYADTEEYFAACRNVWYVMLLNHDFIRERITEIWKEVYYGTNGFDSTLDMMLQITRNYEKDLRIDAEMWNRKEDLPEEVSDRITEVAKCYQWLLKRIAWLNEQFSDHNFVK